MIALQLSVEQTDYSWLLKLCSFLTQNGIRYKEVMVYIYICSIALYMRYNNKIKIFIIHCLVLAFQIKFNSSKREFISLAFSMCFSSK